MGNIQYRKPVLKRIEQKANILYKFLLTEDDYVSKEQIGRLLGIKSERSVRDVISLLATKKPIISHSGNRGYKLAKSVADFDDVKRVWAELSSRAEELEKRIQPLINFYEKCKKLVDNQNKV